MKSKKCALVVFICSLVCGGNFMSQGTSDDNKKVVSNSDDSKKIDSSVVAVNPSDEPKLLFAKLNMSDEMQKRPVFHKIRFGECLSGLASRYYENANNWKVIAEYPANRKVVRDGGDTIKESDYLTIPQPIGVDWVLYNPPSGATFASLALDFYGSSMWGQRLKEYNRDVASDYRDHIDKYADVVKLPKELSLNDYVVSDDINLYSVCQKLFGSTEYVIQIAKFNNLDPNKPLNVKFIRIPTNLLSATKK